MIIDALTVGPFAENTYLLRDEASGEAVFVDPGDEPERLLAHLAATRSRLTAIWLTHAHIDHIGAVAAIRRVVDVPIHLHPLDRVLYDAGQEQADEFGLPPLDLPPAPDIALGEGDRLRVGATTFDVVHVPGHAPGHVAFIGDGQILGGDLLFAGSIGRTDLRYADAAQMTRSLARAATWDPDLVVHPGHGPSTTIGREVATNGFLQGLARPRPVAARR